MTAEQLAPIKNSYLSESVDQFGRKCTLCGYMKISLDGGIDIITSKDLVIFDDDNNVVHAICINDDMRSQCTYPIKIISSDYSMIQQVEGILSQQNFEAFLTDGFLTDLLSANKTAAIVDWTREIKNQAQQPVRGTYYKENPIIIPKQNSMFEDDVEDDETEGGEETGGESSGETSGEEI